MNESSTWKAKAAVIALVAVFVALTFTSTDFQSETVAAQEKYQIDIPKGLPADLWWELIPKDNPMSAAKVSLGKSSILTNVFRTIARSVARPATIRERLLPTPTMSASASRV